MHRILFSLLFLSLVLTACSPSGPSTETPPNTAAAVPTISATSIPTDVVFPVITQPVLPPSKLIATVSTPHIEQGPDGAATAPSSYPEGCGYQWARQELPDLSVEFLQSLQQLQPEAQGFAYGYGENCLGGDGRLIRFIPLETDFQVMLQVIDLSNKADLGEWIIKVMRIVDAIPPDQIVGPGPGMVSITFQSNGQQDSVNFYRNEYDDLAAGLSSADIYEALKAQ